MGTYANLAYEEGIRYLQYEPGHEGQPLPGNDHDGEEQINHDMMLAVALMGNVAMCCLKQGDHRRAIEFCTQALMFDDKNVKAYFRMAQAQLAVGEYDSAADSVLHVLELEPQNREAAQLKRSIEAASRQAVVKEKAMFAK